MIMDERESTETVNLPSLVSQRERSKEKRLVVCLLVTSALLMFAFVVCGPPLLVSDLFVPVLLVVVVARLGGCAAMVGVGCRRGAVWGRKEHEQYVVSFG